MGERHGTDLFDRALAFDYGDAERAALMRKVWTPTPWMVDCFTDRTNSERDRSIREWCYDNLGDQAHPIHGREGRWQWGSATIHGWTWIGFASEAELALFLTAFSPLPSPTDKEN